KKMPITETIKNLSYSTLAIRKVFYRVDRCILDKPCSVPVYSNGGQPCTSVVIIYLQVFTCSCFGSNSLIKDAPTIVWVALSWGLPVPPGMFPSRLRHCGTFKVSIPYLKRRRKTSCRYPKWLPELMIALSMNATNISVCVSIDFPLHLTRSDHMSIQLLF